MSKLKYENFLSVLKNYQSHLYVRQQRINMAMCMKFKNFEFNFLLKINLLITYHITA